MAYLFTISFVILDVIDVLKELAVVLVYEVLESLRVWEAQGPDARGSRKGRTLAALLKAEFVCHLHLQFSGL